MPDPRDTDDQTDSTPEAPPSAMAARLDPEALRDAHGRTGRMMRNAGLPFEPEEFDERDDEPVDAKRDETNDRASSDTPAASARDDDASATPAV